MDNERDITCECEKIGSEDDYSNETPKSFFLSTPASDRVLANDELPVIHHLKDLQEFVENNLDVYSRFSGNVPTRLTNAIRYSLLSSGKRLRPILALTASELCGGTKEMVAPVCVAIELVHVYSLIHDDLPSMDDDDLRRGRPTCHKQFDEATAILAGDALLTYAFEVISQKIQDPEVASKSVLTLAKAAGPCGMVGGQADDVAWSTVMKESPQAYDLIRELLYKNDVQNIDDLASPAGLVDFLKRIHRRKTGSLIVAALVLGALTAGANDRQIEVLEDYGRKLGLAFQISDDLLDELGDEATMGKRLHKDKDSGKLTYVSLFGIEKTMEWLGQTVKEAKSCITSAVDVFDPCSIAFKTALYLADYTARRNK